MFGVGVGASYSIGGSLLAALAVASAAFQLGLLGRDTHPSPPLPSHESFAAGYRPDGERERERERRCEDTLSSPYHSDSDG